MNPALIGALIGAMGGAVRAQSKDQDPIKGAAMGAVMGGTGGAALGGAGAGVGEVAAEQVGQQVATEVATDAAVGTAASEAGAGVAGESILSETGKDLGKGIALQGAKEEISPTQPNYGALPPSIDFGGMMQSPLDLTDDEIMALQMGGML